MGKKNDNKNTEEGNEEGNEEAGRGDGGAIIQGQEEELVSSEKKELLDLYQKMKDLGINSIGDLEVKISRL